MVTRYMGVIVAHKKLVGHYMQRVIAELTTRAIEHDNSKFSEAEFPSYEQTLDTFETTKYGTDEYRAALKRIKPAIEHHYQNNRHHPEYHEFGVNGMNLLDVLEMTCDWIAASQRVPGDTLRFDSLQERFQIEPQLLEIIQNTVAHITSEDS